MDERVADSTLAAAVHDIIGVLGTVRLAVSAARSEFDAAFRDSLLDSAEAEVRRLVGLVAAVPVLAGADRPGETMSVAVAELVATAAQQARRRGVDVALGTADVERLECRRSLGEAVGALALIASAGGSPVTVNVDSAPDGAGQRIEITGDRVPDDAIVRGLLHRAGGVRTDTPSGVVFTLGTVR